MRPIRLLLGCLAATLVVACGSPAATTPTLAPTANRTVAPAVSFSPPSAPSPTPAPSGSLTIGSPIIPSPIPSAVPPLVPALTVDHPRVIVTPARGLRDGETVAVRVTGFGVGGIVRVSECASVAASTSLGCGAQLAAQTLLATDDARTGHIAFTVHAEAPTEPVVPTPGAPCASQCVIVATLGEGYGYATAAISFAGR